jgi:hypothetical protein
MPLVWRHHQRPSHPASRVVTIARTPSARGGCADTITNSGKTKDIYFFQKGWTGQIRLNGLAKLIFARALGLFRKVDSTDLARSGIFPDNIRKRIPNSRGKSRLPRRSRCSSLGRQVRWA